MNSPYSALPHQGPIKVAIGQALILLFEPHRGHEQAYNRWYEDDHFLIAGKAAPWAFAGRRWVAPRALQDLRLPANSKLVSPLGAGCYLTLLFVLEGHQREFQDWTMSMLARLRAEGRSFADRSHIFSTFQDYAGAVYRDPQGPRDIHALDYPYAGIVLEVVEAVAAPDALLDWLKRKHIPAKLAASSFAQCLVFVESKAPDAMLARTDDGPPRITLLWFSEDDPRTHWNEMFAKEAARIEAGGLGRLLLAAPFVPTLPGTDAFVDELR